MVFAATSSFDDFKRGIEDRLSQAPDLCKFFWIRDCI